MLLSYIQKISGDKILHLSQDGLLYLAKKVNPFRHDIPVNFSKLQNKFKVENNTDSLAQSIWLNRNKYIENCVFFSNDLVSDNDTLNKIFSINTNFLEFYGIISAIPNRWTSMIESSSKLDNLENKLVDKVKRNQKPVFFSINYFWKMIKYYFYLPVINGK